MRYTLWSRGRLVGHTDLDVHTVTSTMRQGFAEPTDDGRRLLSDATGVWRAIAEAKRASRARGKRTASDDALVLESMQRRESLHLELRDEDGVVFDCDYIRVIDNFDVNNGLVDEMGDTPEEQEAQFQIHLSTLSDEAREEALKQRADSEAEIDAWVDEMMADREEEQMFGSSFPPLAPEDPRFQTMQYLLQVHLKSDDGEDALSRLCEDQE